MSSENTWVEPDTEPAKPKPSSQQIRADLKRFVANRCASDLSADDQMAMAKAHIMVGLYPMAGGWIGLGLGLFGAHRLRANRAALLRAFRAHERPSHIVFASGRTEPIDLATMLKPTRLGNVATYVSFAVAGYVFSDLLGTFLGARHGDIIVKRDPERFKRIETFYRKMQAEASRKEADILELGEESIIDKVLGIKRLRGLAPRKEG